MWRGDLHFSKRSKDVELEKVTFNKFTRQLQKRPWVNPAEGGTSEGGRIDILGEGDDITQSELQQGSGT